MNKSHLERLERNVADLRQVLDESHRKMRELVRLAQAVVSGRRVEASDFSAIVGGNGHGNLSKGFPFPFGGRP